MARGIEDAASLGEVREACGRLRLGGDGMKDVHATNAAALDERAQAARYGFDFGKFGHACSDVAHQNILSSGAKAHPSKGLYAGAEAPAS